MGSNFDKIVEQLRPHLLTLWCEDFSPVKRFLLDCFFRSDQRPAKCKALPLTCYWLTPRCPAHRDVIHIKIWLRGVPTKAESSCPAASVQTWQCPAYRRVWTRCVLRSDNYMKTTLQCSNINILTQIESKHKTVSTCLSVGHSLLNEEEKG